MPGSMPASRSFVLGQPVVGGVDGQAGERLDAAEAGRAGDEAQPVVEALGRGEAALEHERHHPAEGAHLAPRDVVAGVGGQARVEDAAHRRVALERAGPARGRSRTASGRAGAGSSAPRRTRKAACGSRHPPRIFIVRPRGVDPLAGAGQRAAHDVAVAGEGLGQAVHHEVGPEGERPLEDEASRRCCRRSRRGRGAWAEAHTAARSTTSSVGFVGLSTIRTRLRSPATRSSRSRSARGHEAAR